jgi:chromosome segregation ATPase
MLKKVAVAGLAVVVGVTVLCWVCPVVGDWIKLQFNKGKDGIDNSVSLEDKIQILNNKLKDFDKQQSSYFDKYATAERERDTLKKNVDAETARVDGVWSDIQARRQKLDSNDVLVSSKAKRDKFEKQLTADFDAYQIDKKSLDASKDLLEARTKALEDGQAQLDTLKSKKVELEAKLARMENELKLVRQQQAQANLSLNDGDLDKLIADADKLADSISDQKRSLELQKKYGTNSNATQPTPAPASDIKARIDAELDGNKDTGATQDASK